MENAKSARLALLAAIAFFLAAAMSLLSYFMSGHRQLGLIAPGMFVVGLLWIAVWRKWRSNS